MSQKLYKMNPGKMSLELLHKLQGALLAKLILTNKEVIKRYNNLVNLTNALRDAKPSRKVLSSSADKLESFTKMLENRSTKGLGKN